MENESDRASPGGRYPKDLFNKNVVVNGQAMGHVAKETDDLIVVFGDSNDWRFDIPKSKVEVAGGSVIVNGALDQYAVDKDAPLPEGKSLRASAEEIIQKAGEIPESPPVPVEERRHSVVEEKAAEVADEFKGVGREIENAARAAKEKMAGVGTAAASDAEAAAKGVATEAGDLARSGARAVKEKIEAAQSNTEAGLSADNVLRIEKEMRRPDTGDLGSYEGKYPKDLFNRTVLLGDRPVGRVARETDDVIVVFSDTDSDTRFDIPKSEITLAGSSILATEDLLFRYRKRRDEPMPAGRALRPSGEEIRAAAAQQLEAEEKRPTTPDVVMQEGSYLATTPRPETTAVARPEGYVDTESELSKKFKKALAELKEIIVAGAIVAKKKAKKAQLQAEEKHAAMDAEAISRMGNLSTRFADSFEDVMDEIRARTYADQDQIYTGFLRLMDVQRDIVVARRDLARRLKDSVAVPVVDRPGLKAPPELPEDVGESRTLNERKTAVKKKKTGTAKRKA